MEEQKLLDNYSNTIARIKNYNIHQQEQDNIMNKMKDDEVISDESITLSVNNDIINLKDRRISFIEKMLNIEIPTTPEIKHRILSCNSDKSPISFDTDVKNEKVFEKIQKNVELDVQSPFNFRVRFNTNESIESVSSIKKNS